MHSSRTTLAVAVVLSGLAAAQGSDDCSSAQIVGSALGRGRCRRSLRGELELEVMKAWRVFTAAIVPRKVRVASASRIPAARAGSELTDPTPTALQHYGR